ncbi:MAG: hypothetical protein WD873_03970 [Candidatus Hydrogenedentales bacterium]
MLKGAPRARAPTGPCCTICLLQRVNVARYDDTHLRRVRQRRVFGGGHFVTNVSHVHQRRVTGNARCDRFGVRIHQPRCDGPVLNLPCDDEAVGAEASVQLAAGVTVHVFDVFGDACAEFGDVEPGVARDERVEGPVNGLDTQRQQEFALVTLEAKAQVAPLRIRAYGEHIGPMNEAAVFDARHPEDKPKHVAAAVERAGSDAANPLRHFQDRDRHNFGKIRTPRRALQCDTGLVIGQRIEAAQGYLFITFEHGGTF